MAREISQRETVAAVLILEAGGEGNFGMQAVAGVIQNRMVRGRTPYSVVTAPKQFCAYTLFRQNKLAMMLKAEKHPRFKYAMLLAAKLEKRQVEDVTEGSNHYFATSVSPKWAAKMNYKKKIGNHLFYKSS
jgi:spore germination cell wall hydrolase CwlJ-like protein